MALLRRKAKSQGRPIEEHAALERRIEGLGRSPFLRKTVTDPTPAEASVAAEAVAAEMSQEQARNLAQQRLAGLAQRTAGQGGNAAAMAPSRSAARKAAKIGRTGSKFRERAKPQRLKSDYRRFLLWLHARALDLPIERLFFAPTKTPLSIATLSVQSENKALAHDYRATPTLVFDCALSAVEDDLSRFSFVDYGAGKGRVLLLASQHPFRRIVGVEFAEELHDDALMNIAQFPRSRMKCRTVECLLDDAVNIEAIDGEAIHYFFDPFDRQIFAQVLSRIAQSYHAHPRRLYLILVDTDAADLIHRTGIFQKVDVPFIEGIKARLLSPYPISVYRSLA